MASVIYSTRFIGTLVPAGTRVVYTVPAGMVAVVRDITVVGYADALATADVVVPGVCYIALLTYTAGGDSAHWTGRQIVNAGESISAEWVGGADCYMMVSGYLLVGT